LVLDEANHTITHPRASRRDMNSPSLFLVTWQNFWCKHSEMRPP